MGMGMGVEVVVIFFLSRRNLLRLLAVAWFAGVGGGFFLASEDWWENVRPFIPRLRFSFFFLSFFLSFLIFFFFF